MSETLPIQRTTLTQMVGEYREAISAVRECFARLNQAEEKMAAAFGERFDLADSMRHNFTGFDHPERVEKQLKQTVWRRLVSKMEIRRVLSIKKAEELDSQLSSGEGLPDITEENVVAMMQGALSKMDAYLAESVREVFDHIRPRDFARPVSHVTNERNRWELGNKVILKERLRAGYGGGMEVKSLYNIHIRALDNAFHLLDGKGAVKTHYGPLYDAINAGKGSDGETEYFRFKCFGNGNLHIEFKRLDLVARFNAVAGGKRLKGAQ